MLQSLLLNFRGEKMDSKIYSIFISSTYTDLKRARAKVNETILKMSHFPIGMEMFSASSTDQWTIIKEAIDRSDYYIIIIGHRYGSLAPDGISYTEKEYQYAKSTSTPILAFIQDRNVATTPDERENDPVLVDKLDKLIERILPNAMCDFWLSENELANKVSIALSKEFIRIPQIGWVRNDKGLAQSKDISIEDAVNSYIAYKISRGLRNATIMDYKVELNLFTRYFTGKMLSEFSINDINNFLTDRRKNSNITSNKTMEKIRGIVKIMFDWFVEEKWIDKNPTKEIKPYKFENTVTKSLSENEILELIESSHTSREKAMITTFLSTGIKLGEITNILLEDINWEKSFININNIVRGSRVVPLSSEAQYYIKSYINSRNDDSIYLFVSERKPYRKISVHTVSDLIAKVTSRTIIKRKITAKTFRHTFAQKFLSKGVPIHEVQSILGNSNLANTSETYFRINEENINLFID